MAEGSNQRNKQDSPGIFHLCPQANLLCVGHTADPHNMGLYLNMQITNRGFNRANSCFANSFLTTAAVFPVDQLINVQRLGFCTSLGQCHSRLLILGASVALILVCLTASPESFQFISASESSLMLSRAAGFVFCLVSMLRWLHKRSNECCRGEMERLRAPSRGEGRDGSEGASS